MKKESTQTINILDEAFEIPACNCDLQELIEISCAEYLEMNKSQDTRKFKVQLNSLIDTYNERREMNIYNKVK